MTEGVNSIDVDIPCLKAASMMWLRKYRRIPVTQQGELIGIISIGDVHRAFFKSCMTS
jgi:signal-transduction protein with cAMP-binding, CBS, and nucleotidyltransferase domain